MSLFLKETYSLEPDDYSIDKSRLQEWINAHEEYDEECDEDYYNQLIKAAVIFANHIRYVPLKEWLTSLQITVSNFSKRIEDRPYAIILPRMHVDMSSNKCKSGPWVTHVVLDILPNLPVAMYDTIAEAMENGFTEFLLCDDVVYTGMSLFDDVLKNSQTYSVRKAITDNKLDHLYKKIDLKNTPMMDGWGFRDENGNVWQERGKKPVLYVLVGAATNKGIKKFQTSTPEDFPFFDVKFLDGMKIFMLGETLSTKELNVLQEIDIDLNLATTYFQHKMADDRSILESQLRYGKRLQFKGHTKRDDEEFPFIKGCVSGVVNDKYCPEALYKRGCDEL